MRDKTPSETKIEMRELVMPAHTNPQNSIFGGVIMSWMDTAAAMVAEKHAQGPVVTAHIDSISFKAPVYIGHHVRVIAIMEYVGTSSMEIGVEVIAENPQKGLSCVTTTAKLTFVAMDDYRRPMKVPRLILETDEEKDRYEEAKKRVEERKKKSNA